MSHEVLGNFAQIPPVIWKLHARTSSHVETLVKFHCSFANVSRVFHRCLSTVGATNLRQTFQVCLTNLRWVSQFGETNLSILGHLSQFGKPNLRTVTCLCVIKTCQLGVLAVGTKLFLRFRSIKSRPPPRRASSKLLSLLWNHPKPTTTQQ